MADFRLDLPPGVQLVYLAEGGANVIFQFVAGAVNSRKRNSNQFACPVQPTGLDQLSLPPEFRGKLLRLRKETPSAAPYLDTARNFDKIIRPLFSPEELVDQCTIHLPKGLIQRCNEQLQVLEMNGRRPAKRHGVYLATTEPFGLLVSDMTARGDPGTVVAELKPKWLLQSPSAPPNARRCRTCALHDMKSHESTALGRLKPRMFCPLDLVSDKFDNVLRATSPLRECQDRMRLARLLFRNHTLLKLQLHQSALQDVGLYGPSPQSREKSLAMTLRDCTVFIKIPLDDKSPVELRLGDLDLKSGAAGKAQYWLDLETRLINEGWYAGVNVGQEHSVCALHGARKQLHSSS